MPTTIQFLRDPKYQDSVVLFVLAPAGIQFDSTDIGKNLFGTDRWTHEALLIDGLAPKATFRYSDISFHWTDFLDLAFRHVDHGLFFVPHKRTFKEIGKDSLVQQNPDLYSFSFHKFVCEARKGIAQTPTEEARHYAFVGAPGKFSHETKGAADGRGMENAPLTAVSKQTGNARSAADKLIETRSTLQSLLDAGWSANAVSNNTGVSPMTIGSIKHGRSTQVSTRVHAAIIKMKSDADAGRIVQKSQARGQTRPAADPSLAASGPSAVPAHYKTTTIPSSNTETEEGSLLRGQYVAVDARQLEALIDRLSNLFAVAIGDLGEIRRQISR